MTDIVEITLDNGKYKIIQSNTEFKALRYGEQWRNLTGDNLILFLVYEIESLRQQLAECQAELAKAKENDVCAYFHRRHQQEQYKDD